ncbi:MAG: NUDIX domain-containing protein [Parcubacteria group bacterium]
MKLIKLINPENVSEEEVKNYETREAGRAVVFDEDDKIALLYVRQEDYYKLPGGGIEDGEDVREALNRECLEEAGCNIDITNELGSIVEYRKSMNLKQISYCFMAKVKGSKGAPNFTDEEEQRGFELVWLSYKEALNAFENSKTTFDEGKLYIIPRDRAFIEAVVPFVK